MNSNRIVSGPVLFILVTALSGCQWGGLMGYQEELIQAWGPPAHLRVPVARHRLDGPLLGARLSLFTVSLSTASTQRSVRLSRA